MRSFVAHGLMVLVASACQGREAPSPRAPRAAEVSEQAPQVAERPEIEAEPEPEPPDLDALVGAGLRVAPGPRGLIGTFLWLGAHGAPLDAEAEAALASPSHEAEAAEAFVSDGPRMEIGRRARGRGVVYLGLELVTDRETRAHLLIGLRGRGRVWLDGEPIGEGESEARFLADVFLAPLALTPGSHRLLLRFESPPRGRLRAQVRWLDRRHRPGSPDVALSLGVRDEDAAPPLAADSVRIDQTRALGPGGPEVRLRAHRPAGGVARAVPVRLFDEEGELPSAGARLEGSFVQIRPLPERPLPRPEAVVDGIERDGLARGLVSDHRALRAAASIHAALEGAPTAAAAPLAWRAAELERLVRVDDPDQAWRRLLIDEARRHVATLEAGGDPFTPLRGYERMAHISRLDGTPQPYELFVPHAHRAGGRAFPLLITLHGFKGNAGDYFRNTFGLARRWREGETLVAHGRHGEAPRQGPMIVAAPEGRGQAMYRHAGEIDVLEVIEDVSARLEVDPRRVYITGGSMGGTGAAYLPFRHPDRFAAAAALAGYHDQRVREDTRHEGLTEVERFLQARRSDVDWAENALHLPMLLVRGTRDRPLAWTRSLARRLDELGYRHEHREPELGHNVWTETYAEGAIFRWLRPHRTPEAPRHVRLRTASGRVHSAHWVRGVEREARRAFGEVEARFVADGVIEARVEGLRALSFDPPASLHPGGEPLTVRIGGAELEGPAPLHLIRRGDEWLIHDSAAGPEAVETIRDIYHEPLVFVVGTRDPDHTLINRLVARHWSKPRGWNVSYPIVDDVDLDEAAMEGRALVLVGPPRSNAVLARLADRLPMRFTEAAITLGDRRFEGDDVGAAFVAPHPERPTTRLFVIAGARPIGTWWSMALPDILPGYVIYDSAVAPAREQWSCGGSGCAYLDHGFIE